MAFDRVGSGKSLLARAVATETGSLFVDLSPYVTNGKYSAHTSLMVHMAFKVRSFSVKIEFEYLIWHLTSQLAKALNPAVIYIGQAEKALATKVKTVGGLVCISVHENKFWISDWRTFSSTASFCWYLEILVPPPLPPLLFLFMYTFRNYFNKINFFHTIYYPPPQPEGEDKPNRIKKDLLKEMKLIKPSHRVLVLGISDRPMGTRVVASDREMSRVVAADREMSRVVAGDREMSRFVTGDREIIPSCWKR